MHKNQAYPGEHEPIIDADLWHKVQTTLAANKSIVVRARVLTT